MNRMHKLINLVGIGLPVAGLAAAVVLLWNHGVGITALAILAVGYVFTGLGVTVGYHRLFTHRAFAPFPPSATCSPCSDRWVSRATL